MGRLAIPESAFWTANDVRAAIDGGEPIERIMEIAKVVGWRSVSREGLAESRELIAAGWRPEPLHADDMIYQWRWRRPGKRPGKPGRLFLSTRQAHNAMKREVGGE